MELEQGQMQTESQQAQPPQASQPASADPLTDEAVRAAIANAEAQGFNPETLTVGDVSQGLPQPPAQAPAQTPEAKPEVPAKFLKPDGEVDVEKLIASTRQLDEALKTKETQVQKTIDDYVRDYREKESKFKNLPNPTKLAANLPSQPPAAGVPNDQNLEEVIRRDFQADPVGTVARLTEIMIEKRLEPYEADRRTSGIRSNVEELAKKDPRVLDPNVFAAINAKLESDPDLWKLKNPHKAAWLEVKEEMRLGEPVKQVQAQPSRPPSPVLGGGTPPSSPSSAGQTIPRNPLEQLGSLNVKDRKQEELGDQMVRALLARER